MFPSEIWLACWTFCSTRQLRRLSLSVDTINFTRMPEDWISNVHKLHQAAVRLERIADGPRVPMVRSWTFVGNGNLVPLPKSLYTTNIGMINAMYGRVVMAFSSTLGQYQHLCSLNIWDFLVDRSFRDTLVSLPRLEEVSFGNCDISARDGILLNLKSFTMFSTRNVLIDSLELVSPGRLQTLKLDGRGETIPLMEGFSHQRFSHLTQLSLDIIFDLKLFLRFSMQCPRLQGLSAGKLSGDGLTSLSSHIYPQTIPLLQSIDAPLALVRALTPNRPVRKVIVRPDWPLSAEDFMLTVLDISNASTPVRSLALPTIYPTIESLNTLSSLFPGLTSLSMDIRCDEDRELVHWHPAFFRSCSPEADTRLPDVCDEDVFDSLPPEEVSDAEEDSEQPPPAVDVTLETHPKMPDSVCLHEILSWICSSLVLLQPEIEVLRVTVRSHDSGSTVLSDDHQHQVIATLSRMYPSLRELKWDITMILIGNGLAYCGGGKASTRVSVATGLNTPDWTDFCDSVAADLGAADESESESVAVGWSPLKSCTM
ncbi:hypothetical protein B0H14DRAFT_2570389 [Mycena olivaceomarginata]|nr:hypothetical protein B0H14DRAFT_2570389 [Mycena olivaceomarginata]